MFLKNCHVIRMLEIRKSYYECFFQVGCLFTISAKSMTTLMIGRITGGVAGGGCVFVMPIYIKEISQDDLRGTLGLTVSLARNLGIFVIHAMAGIEYYTILGILLFVSIIGVLVVFKVPESPTYYVKIGKLDVSYYFYFKTILLLNYLVTKLCYLILFSWQL